MYSKLSLLDNTSDGSRLLKSVKFDFYNSRYNMFTGDKADRLVNSGNNVYISRKWYADQISKYFNELKKHILGVEVTNRSFMSDDIEILGLHSNKMECIERIKLNNEALWSFLDKHIWDYILRGFVESYNGNVPLELLNPSFVVSKFLSMLPNMMYIAMSLNNECKQYKIDVYAGAKDYRIDILEDGFRGSKWDYISGITFTDTDNNQGSIIKARNCFLEPIQTSDGIDDIGNTIILSWSYGDENQGDNICSAGNIEISLEV